MDDMWSLWWNARHTLLEFVHFCRRVRVAMVVAMSVTYHYVLVPLAALAQRPPADVVTSATIESVHALNEDPEERGGYHRDITLTFDPETWEDGVRKLTGWDRFRVEVRYVLRDHKYRMVLRPGDTFELPVAERTNDMAPPRGVLSAVLAGAGGRELDVTTRVRKYQGPRGDFHGLPVRVKDMFPFDDHDDNTQRFDTLRVIDATAKIRTFAYAENPLLAGASVE